MALKLNADSIDQRSSQPALCRQRLGIELRRLRETASLRLEDVAAALRVAPSTLSRIETGLAPARTTFVYAMLDLYKIRDQPLRARLMEMAGHGQAKSWLSDFDDVLPAGAVAYVGLESAASLVRSYAALAVPDLAQTSGYAAALCRLLHPPLTAAEASKLAAVTMRRQELAHDTAGQRHHLIVDESALLRRIGPPGVMADQLDWLTAMTGDPSLTIQVAPLNQARQVLTASFTVLSFAEPGTPDLACRGEVHNTTSLTRRTRDVTALAGTFAALAENALPPAASMELIGHLAKIERNRQ